MNKNKIIKDIILKILVDISDYRIIENGNGMYILFDSDVFDDDKYRRKFKVFEMLLPNMVYINGSFWQVSIYPPGFNF